MSDRQPTPTPREPSGSESSDVRDRFIDAYLREQLGAERPTDLRDRILAAAAERLAAAPDPVRDDPDESHPRLETDGDDDMPATTPRISSNRRRADWWAVTVTAAAVLILALLTAVLLVGPDPSDPDRLDDDGAHADDGTDDRAPDDDNTDDDDDDSDDTDNADGPLDLPLDQRAPILVGNRRIDPATGTVLPPIARLQSYGVAEHLSGSRYRATTRDDVPVIVDARSGRVLREDRPELPLSNSPQDRTVTRQRPDGEVIWSRTMPQSTWSVRPPRAVADGDRVVVVQGTGLAGLDRETGETVWQSDGPNDRLFAAHGLVFATSCGSGEIPDRAVVARKLSDGSVAFRVPIPADADPETIEPFGRYLVVRSQWGPAFAVVFSVEGRVVRRFSRNVTAGQTVGDALLALAPGGLQKVDADGSAAWTAVVTSDGAYGDDGGLLAPGSGDDADRVVWRHDSISDSGVHVGRVDPATGAVRWRTTCEPLGVPHSRYWHRVTVEPRGRYLFVISQAAGGHFVEVLRADTGQSIRRWTLDPR